MSSQESNALEVPSFRALAEEVLRLRDEQGIRGIGRERSRYHVHVEPAAFIDKPIDRIAPRELRAWLREMAAKDAIVHATEAPRKLDRSTINRSMSLISVIFAEAIEREFIEMNPCLSVKQKKRVTEADTVEKWAYLTPSEQRAIVDCESISQADKLAIRFAIGTGLRQGEQFNLELADLHIKGNEPHVLVRYSNPHKGKKSPPKSGKRRKVPLMGDALAAAKEWLALLPSFAPSNPLDLVFPTPKGCRRQQGKPLGRTKTIRAIYKAAGIAHRKGLHWHALRHTFASNLISGAFGKPLRIEVIQILMGHSSVMVTQRYSHIGETEILRAVREADLAPAAPPAPDTEPCIVPRECMPDGIPEAFDTVRNLDAVDAADDSFIEGAA